MRVNARDTFLIGARTRVPCVREGAVHRPRLTTLIHARLSAHDVVWITATAGAGKTTAVVHYVESADSPVAWMRLDEDETAPGRFLIYLEQAVLAALPHKSPIIADALERGISRPDGAALLAESICDEKLLLVVDEVERIGGSAGTTAVLAAFLRYAASGTKVLLISRRDIDLGLARADVDGRVGRIRENDLAFSIDEAHTVLDGLGRPEVDAEAAVRATCGWVTGVLFESWRSAEHIHGAGGEVDPLRTYLSSEIMAALDDDCSAFLIRTAVLDVVTPHRAARIGVDHGAELMRRLHDAHLPVEFDGPHYLRCHTRFREFLLERFAELDTATRDDIRFRHAQLLADEHRHEEAVDEFLAAGDPAQAEDLAAEVILNVARRLDIEVVEGWLRSFRPWRVESLPVFIAADLLVALEKEEFGRLARAADRLVASGDAALLCDPRLVSVMAWGYFVVCRVDAAYAVLTNAPKNPQTEAIRFCIGVELVDDPMHYRDRPADPHTEADGLLARVDLAHGRFTELIAHGSSPSSAVRLTQVGALTGVGRLEDAYDHLPSDLSGWTSTRMRAELLAECGRPQEAWSELIAGRDRLAHSESPLYRMFALLTEAMLALRFGGDVQHARAVLRAVELEPTARCRVRVLEQISMWRGLIGLLENDTPEALRHLETAVSLMTRWDRRLFLPAAAVYLAEAHWRSGNEDRSDAAADLALGTAEQIGSTQLLDRALAEFPGVLSRRLDIEEDPDGPWHDRGRTLIVNSETDGAARPPRAVIVEEFDKPALIVGGRRSEIKLVKCVELLGYLALKGGQASRPDVIAALFDSKNDEAANAYLRIAANGVRELMGDNECLIIHGTQVSWNRCALTSTYVETRTAYRRLQVVSGAQRLEQALRILEKVDGREILVGARSMYAHEHRERWATLILDVTHTTAESAYDTAHYSLAHQLVQQVLQRDPYRERAWRLLMKIASAVGDTDRVIAAYRGCEAALSELPTTPSAATRSLLEQLRV